MAGDFGFLQRSRSIVLVCAVLGLTLASGRASASMILATSYDDPSGLSDCGRAVGCGDEGSATSPLAQEFTLTEPDTILSIDAALAYTFNTPFSASLLSLSIVNNASGAPGGTVYAADAMDSGTLTDYPDVGFSDITFTYNPVFLGPG